MKAILNYNFRCLVGCTYNEKFEFGQNSQIISRPIYLLSEIVHKAQNTTRVTTTKQKACNTVHIKKEG